MKMERKVFEDHRKGGYAEVWHVAYPAVLTMFSQTIMSFTDAIMVGRLGAAELAGVGFAGTMVWGLYSFFNGMVYGVNTFVAQDYGAKRYRNIGTMTWQGFYIALASGAILFVLSQFSTDIFRFVGPEESVQQVGSVYLGLRMRGGVFMIMWMCYSAFLRGLGDTRTPLKITLVANVINIAGDYVLIFGKFGFPRLETQGAAVATVFANGVGAALFFAVFIAHRNAVLYGIRSEWRFRLDAMKRLARVGLPMGVQWMLDMGSFIVFSGLIARMGVAQLAGHEAALRLMHVSFMPVFGLSIASTTLVGQYIGAKEMPYAIRSGKSSLRMGFLYTLFIGTVFMVFPDRLVALINSDPDVVRLGSSIVRLAAIFQLADGLGIVSNGCLRGAGDTRWPMFIGIGYAWLLFLPLAYIGGFVLKGGAVGAWAGATLYIMTLGLTFFFRFRSNKWQSIKI